jgi:hypothetical protein
MTKQGDVCGVVDDPSPEMEPNKKVVDRSAAAFLSSATA